MRLFDHPDTAAGLASWVYASLDVLRTAKACGVHVQRPHMLGPLRTSCRRANPSAWLSAGFELRKRHSM